MQSKFVTLNCAHSQTVVETARWRSNPFPFRRGVFQGDPISPIIFLMVFNPILQDLKLEEERIGFKVGDTHHVTLPYADDFCLLTTNLRTHQKMINRINSNITSMGMKLIPSKCRGFAVSSGRASDISFHIGDNVIPSIRDEEQKFLGKLLFFSGKQEQYVVFAHWMLCCPVGYVERGGGLLPVTGLTVQRTICC